MKKIKSIKVEWFKQDPDNSERVGAMYCFNRCDINVN